MKAWAESTDFRTDAQLNLIPSLYNKLRNEGQDFTDLQPDKKRTVQVIPKDPNVVSSQQEQDDIAKAIELSLQEKTGSPKSATNYVRNLSLVR